MTNTNTQIYRGSEQGLHPRSQDIFTILEERKLHNTKKIRKSQTPRLTDDRIHR